MKSSWICLALASFLYCRSFTVAVQTHGICKRKGCTVPSTNKTGICISLENEVADCPVIRDALLAKNFAQVDSVICGEPDLERLNETFVCCAIEEYLQPYTAEDVLLKDHKSFKLLPNPKYSTCGKAISTQDRIIGGDVVDTGALPWMVRLGIVLPSPDDDQIRFTCSGSIINERYVLTAAHCFKQGQLKIVRLAETDEDKKEECILVGDNATICKEVEDIEPEKVIEHKDYTGIVGSPNDIALIRLKQPIRNITSAFTRPVCLPFNYDLDVPDLENTILTSQGVKNLVTVAGWGKENNNDTGGSTKLKQVLVPLRSKILCEHEFKKANLAVTDEQICVGGTHNQGSCAGDSGSPLLANGYIVDRRMGTTYFQIGIVSYGSTRCGTQGSPVVYTRVKSFMQWILDNIEP